MQDEDHDERAARRRSALVKGGLALAVLVLAIAVGTALMVRALGLDASDSGDPVGSGPGASDGPRTLPSTALPVPGEETPSPEGGESTPSQPPRQKSPLQLEVSPTRAGQMERINLTGTYRGSDAVQLQVQRQEGGTWTDFGVSATVRVGTYETYILTGRTGDNRFRMHDPTTGRNSNVVVVTID